MESYFAALIAVNIVCVLIIGMSGWQRGRPYMWPLIGLNILLALYHWLSYEMHTARVLSDAIVIARWHSVMILVSIPLLVMTFGLWSKIRHLKLLMAFYTALVMVLVVLNFATDGTLRFGSDVVLVREMSLTGDMISLLRGTDEAGFYLFHGLFFATLVFLLAVTLRFFRQRKSALALSLIAFFLVQIAVSYLSYQIDTHQVVFFYMGGLPLSLLSLVIAVAISISLKSTSAALEKQQRQRIKLETAFARIAKTVSAPGSRDFYSAMVSVLYDFAKADLVLLGQIASDDPGTVNTVVVLREGKNAQNFSYQLKGTPCENAIQHGICRYEKQVAALFPGDTMLADEGIESYLGVAFQNSQGETTGLLALLYRHPVETDDKTDLIMQVFAARAGAEFERDHLESRLKRMAYTDYISGLPNRARLLEVVNQTFFDCQRHHRNAMLMLVDLDGFGEINRKYGNDVGDQVIRQIGNKLSHYASGDIFIARNGGDEFVVLLKTIQGDARALMNVHWAAISAIINGVCQVGHRRVQVMCSMGAVVFPEQISERFDTMSAAEHALKQAKENGRNQCSLFDPEMLTSLVARRELNNDLAAALRSPGQLSVVYQPKVNHQGVLFGAEALLRWHHPVKGIISPAEFIPMAEESGVIHALGLWVLTEVCEQIRRWKKLQVAFGQVSVNVTAMQFDDPGFAANVQRIMKACEVSPDELELEITESGLLSDSGAAVETLTSLRGTGMSVALDDFGTGYSSLSYLRDLPIDVLKIDKSFVDNLFDARSAELIRAIIAIGKVMQLAIIAEGTETEAQVKELHAMGCDYYQGYYFSRPLPADDYARWLTAPPSLLPK
ncbi:putative bifunctional diguanylate cyclase/phosphodiesterase [Alteromonas sp. CYL-A6]|uniref:putative bifunctional diguanylate cyclase/phosphodiesterase n=1 Tax=Alteromonas nitratireducens TaxID=3390813 RepID=UPI0034B3493A